MRSQFALDISEEPAEALPPPLDVSIAWRNLRFEAGWPNRKTILRRLNGHFSRYTLNGLMGPSGAGKTTLLNCLSGINRSGLTANSQIYLNSDEKWPISSFVVPQHVHESIVGSLTVGQVLSYAFHFKNGFGVKREVKQEHMLEIMHQLKLSKGTLETPFEKCSGGEQKRIAVAQELMSLQVPSFLFLDEPTTGLDSETARLLCECLLQLARDSARLTIIASIHTPNMDTLSLFSKLYVLARGGVCVYSGPPASLRQHLREELFLPVSKNQQPAIEVLIKLACSDSHTSSIVKLADPLNRLEYDTVTAALPQLRPHTRSLAASRKFFSPLDALLQTARQLRVTFLANWKSLFWQLVLYLTLQFVYSTTFRRDMVLPAGCFSPLEDGLACEHDISQNDRLNENLNYFAIFFLLFGFISVSTGAFTFTPMLPIFASEHRNKWYSLGVFFCSSNVVTILDHSLFAILNALLAYFSTGQHAIDDYSINWTRLGHFLLAVWLNFIYCQSIGQVIGAIISDQFVAILASITTYVVCVLQNDYFFKVHEVGIPFLSLVSELVGFRYVFRYYVYIFYGFDRCQGEAVYSLVLEEHLVDPNQVSFYITRLGTNILAARIFTLLYMYFKFNNFSDSFFLRIFKRQTFKGKESTCLPIDYIAEPETEQAFAARGRTGRRKSVEEIQFELFSQNKLILAWRNLTLYGSSGSIYENAQATSKVILRNLSGQFRFGSLNALMGTSGAGKSSLLRVLNGQHKTRLDSESLLYLSKFTKIRTCFISQEVSTHLLPGLTAKQSLIFASRLKNLNEEVDHEAIAMKLLEELDLKTAADTALERCSGGEMKRLALALELTTLEMPNLVCIDEPTSGLDSNSAQLLVSCLRKIAQKNHICIIASIHQPNSEILTLMDQLYVLARGGQCVYSGPPNQIRTHLSKIHGIRRHSSVPVETLIGTSCEGPRDSVISQQVLQVNVQWNSKEMEQQLTDDLDKALDGIQLNRRRFSFGSLYILLCRALTFFWQHLWRQWAAFAFIYIIFGLVLRMYWNSSIATVSGCLRLEDEFNITCGKTAEKLFEEKQVKSNVTYAFFFSVGFVLITMMQSTFLFYQEIVYFVNEHRNGWYTTGVYYIIRSLGDMVPFVPIICLYVYIINIYEPVLPGIYWSLLLVIILSLAVSQSLSHIIIVLAKQDVNFIIIAIIGIFNIFLLWSNFYIKMVRVHYIYQFLSNFTFTRFTLEAILLLLYGFGRCAKKEIQPVLYLMELEDEDYATCIIMLVINLIVFRCIAFALLIRKMNPIENRQIRVNRVLQYQQNYLNLEGPLKV